MSIPVLNMKAYVDKTTLVLGPQERMLGNFQIHPLIREDWSSKDWFCDAMNLGHTLTAYDPYYDSTAGSYNPLPANELFYVATTGRRHSGPYNMFHADANAPIEHDADWGTLEQAHWIYPPSGWPFSLGTYQSPGASPAAATEIWALPSPPPLIRQPGVKATFNVHPRNAAWNEGILGNPTGSMENFLSQNGYGTAWAGDPYFVSYTTRPGGLQPTDDRMVGATTANQSIFSHLVTNTDWIHDHTFIMPENQEVLPDNSKASVGLTVQPVYNYFIDSDPDYESIIDQLPEPMIPNYYMVESSLQEGRDATSARPANFTYMEGASENGSSYPLRFGFGGNEGAGLVRSLKDLFEGKSPTGPSEPYDNRQGFYQLYASIMEDIIKGTPDMDLAIATDRANSQFRDIAVLTADLSYIKGGVNIIADNRGTTDTTDDMMAIDGYPFYNMVTITPALPPNAEGNSQYKISGFQHGSQMDSIFNDLLKNLPIGVKLQDFDALINTLQLIVCKSLSAASDLPPVLASGISGSTSAAFVRGNNEATTWARIEAPVLSAGDANYNLPIAFELERLLSYMSPDYDQKLIDPAIDAFDTPVTRPDEELARHLHASWLYNNNRPEGNGYKNFTILRDPARVANWHKNLWSSIDDRWLPDGLSQQLLPPSIIRELLNQIALRCRSLGDTWHGTPSFSETFMYVVEKRAIPAGSTTADLSQPPVQKLYFGMPYGTSGETIQYIDTQIKYGVRYQYDLKDVRIVVGSRYRYTAADSTLNISDTGQGRAIANALGFYKEEGARSTQLIPLENKLREALLMESSDLWPYPPYAEEDENVTPHSGHSQDLSSHGIGWGQGNLIGYYLYRVPGNTTIFDLMGAPQNPANPGPYVFNITTDDPNNNYDAVLSVDWSKLNIQIKSGFGMGGNETGGALPASPGAASTADPLPPPGPGGGNGPPRWNPPSNPVDEDDIDDPSSSGDPFGAFGETLYEMEIDENGNMTSTAGEKPTAGRASNSLNEGADILAAGTQNGCGDMYTDGNWIDLYEAWTDPAHLCYDYLHTPGGAGQDCLILGDTYGSPTEFTLDANSNIIAGSPNLGAAQQSDYYQNLINVNWPCHEYIEWHYYNHTLEGTSASGGPTTCFIAGTLVELGNGSFKNIENIEIGDLVKTHAGVQPVLALKPGILGHRRLYSINGSEHFATGDHPFMTRAGWKSADPELTQQLHGDRLGSLLQGALKVGDHLESTTGAYIEIESMQEAEGFSGMPVYTFTVAEDHSYYANGYLVHNK